MRVNNFTSCYRGISICSALVCQVRARKGNECHLVVITILQGELDLWELRLFRPKH